jgi:hypothetical protein
MKDAMVSIRRESWRTTMLELIVEAIYAKKKIDILHRMNLYLEKLIALMQISVGKKYISLSQYEHISVEINEAGKLTVANIATLWMRII